MWYRLGQFILKYKIILLLLLLASTVWMGYKASHVQMGYDFAKAIPVDNPKYKDFLAFKKKFGDDGNTMVLGIETDKLYTPSVFNALATLQKDLKTVSGVEDIMGIPEIGALVKEDSTEKLSFKKIFHLPYTSQVALDSDKNVFLNYPFYNGKLYNAATNASLMAVRLNKDTANSKSRTRLVNDILDKVEIFQHNTNIIVHLSGLPYIRTNVSDRIQKEMYWFLIGSLVLSAITLLIFFRSFSAMLMSLLVVIMGVVWSLGTMVLFDYKITLLTALIPPLIVVIGVPNCIYFLNKYHTSYRDTNDKQEALRTMVGRMGVVTLFCNIAAAIGFAVFAFTESALLKEFGVVSGINIMMLFVISLIFIPSVLSFLPAPKSKHVKYLDNKFLEKILVRIERWTFHHAKTIYLVTAVILIAAVIGITRLKSEGYIVDDLPKNDKIYTDLKWFEKNFDGIMPLEITVEAKKKNGLLRSLEPIEKIDAFSQYIADRPETAKPLSFVEGLKFAKQAYYDGDSVNYTTPTEFDMPLMGKYLKQDKKDTAANKTGLSNMLRSFIDSNKQTARISVNMKDIGSAKLPLLLKDFDSVAKATFDTSKYKITFTGTSVTFLEGTSFIINGLKESIMWAFLLIALCMLYLFRSARILLCSLIPNLVPLVITAGVMGWTGIALKPSTVLIFSVALGIVIDVTIRFLVNYKQELPLRNDDVEDTLIQTIRHTGISIIYTSLVLIAGFIIFCVSDFGGTKALGWLTSLTLLVGTVTNLVLLPVLINTLVKKKKSK
ncbi:MMPL family transporter [Panacibacter ginsenosidivorans]|uniref:MMPL family transporter n=1 Tax=Panacibacter ginsenosidivorans TaxID=1813871 RepID=A0A5B8V8G6_9BACT|nr:MMPL family transporter [Panacibacter ginsenosidivorans]QEC67632.1 MMPL family transporter [Panacibacter ginsenosidivorans]